MFAIAKQIDPQFFSNYSKKENLFFIDSLSYFNDLLNNVLDQDIYPKNEDDFAGLYIGLTPCIMEVDEGMTFDYLP